MFPTYRDRLPKVFIEAALFGLPIITTEALDSIGLLPDHEKSGLVIPSAHADALATAMRAMCDKATRQAYGAQAVSTVKDFCHGQNEVDGFRQAIQKVRDLRRSTHGEQEGLGEDTMSSMRL